MNDEDVTQLDLQIEDGIATLMFNDPKTLNAVSGSSAAGPAYDRYWRGLLHSLKQDAAVKVVVLTGAGDKSFSSGANVKKWGAREAERKDSAPPPLSTIIREGSAMPIVWLRHLQKPTIAMVNGLASGMGADFALACDMRIASDRAWFQWSYILRGMVPMEGACWLLPRLVGQAKAMELIMTGDRVDAQEALRLGIVNKVVPHEKLRETTFELANKIAKAPMAAIQSIRAAIYAGERQSLQENIDYAMLTTNLQRQDIAASMIAAANMAPKPGP
jgi:enoyl-CoA hydratase/carnithine racemase